MNFTPLSILRVSRSALARLAAGSTALATAALLLPPLAGAAPATTSKWTATGPYGGIVGTLVVDPKHPATLYAASPGGGVFKSLDHGAHWAPAMTGLVNPAAPNDPTVLTLFSLAIDPAHSNILYTGGQEGLFKSIDGAAHWTQVGTGSLSDVQQILIDPKTPTTLYAVASFGTQIFKSVDSGATWAPLSGLPFVSSAVLAVDPKTSGTIYAGSTGTTATTATGGIYKSTDAGKTWKRSTAGLGTGYIVPTGIWVDPKNTALVYAAVFGVSGSRFDLVKSSNGGVSWVLVASNKHLDVEAMDPSNPSVFYATDGFGAVFRTQNAGATWAPLAPIASGGEIRTIAIDPGNSNRLYAGTDHGVFASTDLGKQWSEANQGLANALVTALALDPKAPATLYAGTERSGIFKTTNGGQTWTRQYDDVGGKVSALLIDPTKPSTLYFSDSFGNGVFKSTNAGATWTSVLPYQVTLAMALDPLSPQTLFASPTAQGGVAKSIDGGKTWKSANTGLPAYVSATSLSAYRGFVLLTDPHKGVFLSKDEGKTWTADTPTVFVAAGGASLRGTAPLPVSGFGDGVIDGWGNNLFISILTPFGSSPTLGWVKPSQSGGAPTAETQAATAAKWTPWSAPAGMTASDCLPVTALAADPVTRTTFYAGGLCGVLKGSTLTGKTTVLGAGLPNLPVNAIAITPKGSDLYAATYGGGVYRYTVPAK